MLDLHRQAMGRSVDIVNLVRDDQWQLPTPCSQWTLQQLVQHMTSENHGFAAAAGGETEDRSAWTLIPADDDLRRDYALSAERVVTAFAANGVLARQFWLPRINDTVTFPAQQAISFHLLDFVVHGWDVAAALAHPITFDDDLVDAVLDIAYREVPNGPNRRRQGASFQPPPETATPTEQDRMLVFLGRSPTWPD